MDDIDAFDLVLHDLLYDTQQYSNAIEKEKQLITDHEKRIEENKQSVQNDVEVAIQREEDVALLQKQLLQSVKNIESLKETCNVLSNQEHCLDGSLKKLTQDGLAKEADHLKVLAHYDDVNRQRREMYETQAMSIELSEKDALRVEFDGHLGQLMIDIDSHQHQITEQLKCRDEFSSFPVITNTNDFCIKLAEMYVANTERYHKINQEKSASIMLEKHIEELNVRLAERAAQERHYYAIREAHLRTETMAKQQKKTEEEWVPKDHTGAQNMTEHQKEAHDNWVQKEVHTRAQIWAEQQKKAEDEWVRKEVHARAQAMTEQQTQPDNSWIQKDAHTRAKGLFEQQIRAEVECTLNTRQNDNGQVIEVEVAEVNRQQHQSASQPLSRVEMSLNNLSLYSNPVANSAGKPRSPPKILFPSVTRCDKMVKPVMRIDELLKSIRRHDGEFTVKTNLGPSSTHNSINIPTTVVQDTPHSLGHQNVASTETSTSHSSMVLDSTTASNIATYFSSAITLTTSTTAMVSPVQYADSNSVSNNESLSEHLNAVPKATKTDTRINCPMTSALGIPNKMTAAVSPLMSINNEKSILLMNQPMMNSLSTSDPIFALKTASRNTEVAATETLQLPSKLSNIDNSGWTMTNTPHRPFIENTSTPDIARDVNMCNKSAHFDWSEHMSALKKLATSPGITLYTGRRMFSCDSDADMCAQQLTQLSQNQDCVMEMDADEANISNANDQIASAAKSVSCAGPVHSVQDKDASNEFLFNMGQQSYMDSNETRTSDDGKVFNDLFNLSCDNQPEYTLSETNGNKVLPFGPTCATGSFESKNGAFYFGHDKDEITNVSNSTYPGSFEFSFGCNTPGSVLEKSPGDSVAFSLSFGNSIVSPSSDDNPFKLF